MLWLLHGGLGSSRDWTVAGDAEELTAGLPLIVVMPDAGALGWYADWKRVPREGPQNWETFHLRELRPYIEERYQTRTDRHGRAAAGVSMGGFGAMRYASVHPDLFGFAASLSGAVDILHPVLSFLVTISPLEHRGLPDGVFGNRILDEATWRANNPVDLAERLRDVEIQIRTGNGFPPEGGFDISEFVVWQASTTLHNRLDELSIAHVFDVVPGGHNFTVAREALRKTLPGVVAHAADHSSHL